MSEVSLIKRAAIVFLWSKLYFTDDVGNVIKLRIIGEEWTVLSNFIEAIKQDPQFVAIRVMFYHLFTEKFFRFTVKNKALALDFGTPDSEEKLISDNRETVFWSDIRREIEILENTGVVELTQLNSIREEAIKPFANMFPEQQLLKEALKDFDELKLIIQPTETQVGEKVTRRKMSQACRNFLKKSGVSSHMKHIDLEEVLSENESELNVASTSKKAASKRKLPQRKPKEKLSGNELLSSESDGEEEFKKMNRSIGYTTQNVMRGIGAVSFPNKLKKCYEKPVAESNE